MGLLGAGVANAAGFSSLFSTMRWGTRGCWRGWDAGMIMTCLGTPMVPKRPMSSPGPSPSDQVGGSGGRGPNAASMAVFTT
jgi:hypothetical protein